MLRMTTLIYTQELQQGIHILPILMVYRGESVAVTTLDISKIPNLTASIAQVTEMSFDCKEWVALHGACVDLPRSGFSLDNGVLYNEEGGPVQTAGLIFPVPKSHRSRYIRTTLTLNQPSKVGVTIGIW